MATRSIWRPAKDEVVAEQGTVASLHPLASEAGVEVLRQGGNAIDATVAMGFCLAVVEPMMSCIAGHGQMLAHMDGKTVTLDFSHRAPKAAKPDMYKVVGEAEGSIGIYEVEDQANAIGYQSIGVPGVTAGLCKAHELFGTLPLEQLMEPAIHYAENGITSGWYTTLRIADAMSEFIKYGEAANVFLHNGYPPVSETDKIVQKDLGQTLRRIAREGKDALYRGEIPHAIEEDMKENGGLLRVADFDDYRVQVSEPARAMYRGHEILGMPVIGGGITQLQTLNILQNFDLGSLGHNSAEFLHLFVEVARHAFADRYHYLGDPDFVGVPLQGILSKDYAGEIARQIDQQHASLEDEKKQPWVLFAEKPLHDPWAYDDAPRPDKDLLPSFPSTGDCTTHFGVIDAHRNMVACTQTAVGSFGSRVITPGTGVLFTNGMLTFNPMPAAANSIAGYKRPLNNMGPLLVLRGGKPFLSLGAPGGRKILNCLTQLIVNLLDHDMGIQDAITAPRVDAADRETHVDSRIDEATIEALRQMGHSTVVVAESPAQSNFALPVGLMVNPETGNVHAGVDVFRTGAVARGY